MPKVPERPLSHGEILHNTRIKESNRVKTLRLNYQKKKPKRKTRIKNEYNYGTIINKLKNL